MAKDPRFTFDAASARYRSRATGRFVSNEAVRRAIDARVKMAGVRMSKLARQLQRREITVQEWELGMRREVKRIHIGSAEAAKGGFAQMAPADYGRVGQLVRTQYKFLNRFAQQIEAGLPLDGRFLRRVELYAEAGRTTYQHTLRVVMTRAGYAEERNILNPADHCPGCLDATALGWVAIGTLPQVGTRDCLSRCKCEVVYRK